MAGWRPWQELKRREHLTLRYARLHPSRGRIVEHCNGLRTITLDSRLDQITRNAVLAHELVHDEFDLLWPDGTPDAIVAKGENFVCNQTADRLVPPDELQLFVDNLSEFEGVTARDVGEKFLVPIEVAHLALLRLVASF